MKQKTTVSTFVLIQQSKCPQTDDITEYKVSFRHTICIWHLSENREMLLRTVLI